MNTKYFFEVKPDYLIISISGEYDLNDFKLLPQIILDECEKEKINKVLINALQVQGTNIPTMDRFFLGEEMARVFAAKIKAAVVWPEKDIDKFAETVAVNRGGNVCVLSSISSADKWLMNMHDVK